MGNRVFEEEHACSIKLPRSTFTSAKCVIDLSYLYFSNLLIIHSFGSAVASHSVGGCRPPIFFFFMSIMRGKME